MAAMRVFALCGMTSWVACTDTSSRDATRLPHESTPLLDSAVQHRWYDDFDLIAWAPRQAATDTALAKWEVEWQGTKMNRVVFWPSKAKQNGLQLQQKGDHIAYAGYPHPTQYPDQMIFPSQEDSCLYYFETCYRSRIIWMRMSRSLEPQFFLVFHHGEKGAMLVNAFRVIALDQQWLAVEQPTPSFSGTWEKVQHLEGVRPSFASAMRRMVPGDTSVPWVSIEGDPLIQHTPCLFGQKRKPSDPEPVY